MRGESRSISEEIPFDLMRDWRSGGTIPWNQESRVRLSDNRCHLGAQSFAIHATVFTRSRFFQAVMRTYRHSRDASLFMNYRL